MKNGVTRSGSGGLCIGGAKQVSPFFCLPVGARGGRFTLKVSLESAPEAAGKKKPDFHLIPRDEAGSDRQWFRGLVYLAVPNRSLHSLVCPSAPEAAGFT